jgi:hypothetical protein
MTKAYSRKEDPKRGALMGAFAIGSDKAINCLVLRCQNYGGGAYVLRSILIRDVCSHIVDYPV